MWIFFFFLPQHEGHVALLTLVALHGAVQRHAGVSEGKVVQLPIHVVGVAFVGLETQWRQKQCFFFFNLCS